MKLNHYITFTGPAYVPVGTDETSARETTGATLADVGIQAYLTTTDTAGLSVALLDDAWGT